VEVFRRFFGSLVSRVAVTNTYKELAHLPKSLYFSSRCLPEILSGYVSFYHELHEWTNGTNLLRFSIREICLLVPFVISTASTHRGHNLSTRCLQRELPKSQSFQPYRHWIKIHVHPPTPVRHHVTRDLRILPSRYCAPQVSAASQSSSANRVSSSVPRQISISP
jgi:hypothetical protein